MKDYIEQALRTESKLTPELLQRLSYHARAIHALMGMQTEIGELVDAYKRHIFYGAILDMTNAAEEIGDVAWYMAILLDVCGISFEQCMEANIAKLRARYPDKFCADKAVNRDLNAERKELERMPVKSSNVASIGWADGVMEVEFIGGGIYRYYDVPEILYKEMMTAESKGVFLNRRIKPHFKCDPVAPPKTIVEALSE